MVKTTFSDPIAPKEGKDYKTPWDFRCPPYDERTSCYVNAGGHWGVGHRNPVGHDGKVKQRVPTLPYGKREGMKVDEVPRKPLDVEMLE